MGANAIVKFEYGQRGKTGIFGGLIDAEKWFGSGIAVKVSPSLLSEVPDRSSENLTWKGW